MKPDKITIKERKGKESEVAQSCPTLCDPMECSLPGSSVHGIFQAIVLERIAISFSSRSSRPRDGTQVSRLVERRFTVWATRTLPLFSHCDDTAWERRENSAERNVKPSTFHSNFSGPVLDFCTHLYCCRGARASLSHSRNTLHSPNPCDPDKRGGYFPILQSKAHHLCLYFLL